MPHQSYVIKGYSHTANLETECAKLYYAKKKQRCEKCHYVVRSNKIITIPNAYVYWSPISANNKSTNQQRKNLYE